MTKLNGKKKFINKSFILSEKTTNLFIHLQCLDNLLMVYTMSKPTYIWFILYVTHIQFYID